MTELIVEAPEAWMEGLRTIASRSRTDVLRGFWSELPDAVCQGRTINSIAIYQNTSGSTNVPKTFGLSLERVFRLSTRYAGDEKERRVLRTGSIEFDPIDCTGSVRCWRATVPSFSATSTCRTLSIFVRVPRLPPCIWAATSLALWFVRERKLDGFHPSQRITLGARGCLGLAQAA